MLCKKPYMVGSLPVGCSQCLPCRINRRRVWTHRMMLESLKHAESCFVTLTYEESRVPVDGSLVPGDARDWLKRLRRQIYPSKVRYFLVGEYGDQSERPHYHAALFGLSRLVGGGLDGRSGVVQDSWGLGYTFVGSLTRESAQYVAGYVTKKMTGRDDERLRGRYPEFARMSLRPGIGAPAVGNIANAVGTDAGLDSVADGGDVPFALRHGGKLFPLGRYLRGKLRAELGLSKDVCSREASRRAIVKMQELYKEDVELAKASSVNVQKYRLDKMTQKLRNVESRFNIFSHPERRIL